MTEEKDHRCNRAQERLGGMLSLGIIIMCGLGLYNNWRAHHWATTAREIETKTMQMILTRRVELDAKQAALQGAYIKASRSFASAAVACKWTAPIMARGAQ